MSARRIGTPITGVNALWVLDRNAAGSPPRLIRDQEKSSTEPRWSADGRWLYFLSSRSGSVQVWRAPAGDAEAKQMTSLPVDVAFYRISEDGRLLVAAMNVFPDCDTLACTKAKSEAKAKTKASGTLYTSTTPRFWDAYLDGRFINLFAVKLDGAAPATEATALTRGYQADIVSKPEGDEFAFVVAHRRQHRAFRRAPFRFRAGLGRTKQSLQCRDRRTRGAAQARSQIDDIDRKPCAFADGAEARLSLGRRFAVQGDERADHDPRHEERRRSSDRAELRSLADVSCLVGGWRDALRGRRRRRAGADLRRQSGERRRNAIDGRWSCERLDIAKGVVIYSRDALDSPSQVYELGAAVRDSSRMSAKRALAQTPMSAFEQFSFTGWNGEVVHGYVVKPAGFRRGPQISRRLPHSWRALRLVRQCLELSLESASLVGHGLCRR